MKLEDFFWCPNCCGELKPTKYGFKCCICSSEYDNKEGVPCFIHQGLRIGYSFIPDHHELNQRAVEFGWKDAVIAHLDKYRKAKILNMIANILSAKGSLISYIFSQLPREVSSWLLGVNGEILSIKNGND